MPEQKNSFTGREGTSLNYEESKNLEIYVSPLEVRQYRQRRSHISAPPLPPTLLSRGLFR